MIGDEVLSPIRVPEGVKITCAAYCQLPESDLPLGLADIHILLCCKLNFQDKRLHLKKEN